MCGIAGILKFNGKEQIKEESVRKMVKTMICRGPDDKGFYFENFLGLGHCRLSIIDLTSGHQPIYNEDKSLQIVYNGEVYNFAYLRQSLKSKGHQFYTQSDTEVILHLYEEKGENCVKDLDGVFAFAIWDKKKQQLFLARDPLGEKPLHWALFNNQFVFSSEIKGILAHPGFKKEIDRQSLNKYLFYGFVPAPATIFSGIKKLLPGYLMTVDFKGHIKEKKYWEFDYSRKIKEFNPQLIKKKTVDLLKKAVEKRLIADVPLGVFLSGGVDSSLVVAMMSQILPPSQIQAFSIGFKEKDFDESIYAKKVAKHLGIKHHLKIFSQKEVLNLIPKVADFLDEPMADPSILPTFLLSQFTRQKVKVALSGDGGDENFGGYPKYLAHWFLQKTCIEKFPLFLFSRFFEGKKSDFLKYGSSPLYLRNQFWVSHFDLSRVERLTGGKVDLSDLERYHQIFNGKNNVDEAFFLDQKTILPDLFLVKTDRASMAASLEVRSPFLDKELTDFCSSLPFSLKLKGFRTKNFLKEIALDFLPKEVILRPKMGFGVPLKKWFKHELKALIGKELSFSKIKKEGFFNPVEIQKILKENKTIQIWNLFVFERWYQKWLKN